jgi:hypothetical protein
VWRKLTGTCLGYNNNYAGIAISPRGTLYLGVLGGAIKVGDGTSPGRWQRSAAKGRRQKSGKQAAKDPSCLRANSASKCPGGRPIALYAS